MNIQQIIDQAREIESTTDAKFAGAVMQVTKRLSIDECESIFTEAQVSPRVMRNVERTRNGDRGFSVYLLQDTVSSMALQATRQ
jgi:hypothetical protein